MDTKLSFFVFFLRVHFVVFYLKICFKKQKIVRPASIMKHFPTHLNYCIGNSFFETVKEEREIVYYIMCNNNRIKPDWNVFLPIFPRPFFSLKEVWKIRVFVFHERTTRKMYYVIHIFKLLKINTFIHIIVSSHMHMWVCHRITVELVKSVLKKKCLKKHYLAT